MIHVQRTDIPTALNGDDSPGGRERARWQAYHEGKRKRKPGDFSAYSDESVKKALIEMFHRKCAYCDSVIPVGDVEHWRPKNAVSSENRKQVAEGYWWLAADWDNLLYSCTGCNQRRSREIEDRSGLIAAGKGTQFPLLDESIRAQKPGEESRETPLLLNPCFDLPEEHLQVAVVGREAGVLQPLLDPSNQPDPRATASITIYGLNAVAYVRRRKRLLRFLSNRQADVNRILAAMPVDKTSPQYADWITELRHKLGELKTYLDEEQEDLLLVQQVLTPYLRSLGVKLD